jgi:3-oxoacyl-[acyl-carrier protein] reductase
MTFNLTEDDWDSVIDVHLMGHYNLLHEFGKLWRQRFKDDEIESQRSFLAVLSASSRENAGQLNYSAAKAGVLGLTRTGARDLHPYNVPVSALMPAALTPLLEDGIPDEILEDVLEDAASPDRVAPLPVALTSDEAEDITWWTFGIGGNSVYMVTDPEFERLAIKDGGWTAEDLTSTFDQLLANHPRSKTEPGGLLGCVLETL